MEKFSEWFSREEFKCSCGNCDRDVVDHELITVLSRLRDYFKYPIKVTSGNRCPAHNENVGGSPRSEHLNSKAADISMQAVLPEDIYNVLDSWYPNTYGLGLYSGWVHIDVRSNRARW